MDDVRSGPLPRLHDDRVRDFINRSATPLTTGLFAVSGVSGVALFFHLGSSIFHGMHEWLSVALLLPFGLHMWKNWRSLTAYFRRGTLVVPLVASFLVAVPFAVSGLSGGGRAGNPAFRAQALLTHARLSDVATVMKTTPNALLTTLQQRGFQAQSTDQTIDSVAAASGRQVGEVLSTILPSF